MSFLWAWTTSISTIDWGRPPSDLGHIVRYVSRASSRNSGRSFVGIGSTHGKIDSSQSKTYNTVITSKKFEEWMKRTSNPWLFIDRLIPRELMEIRTKDQSSCMVMNVRKLRYVGATFLEVAITHRTTTNSHASVVCVQGEMWLGQSSKIYQDCGCWAFDVRADPII